MAQKESKLSRKIMEQLRAHGWFCFKIHGGATMMAGLPDVVVCAKGLFVGLETKNPESRSNVSLRQEITHRQIRETGGGRVFVVCSPEEAVAAVKSVLQSSKVTSSKNDPVLCDQCNTSVTASS